VRIGVVWAEPIIPPDDATVQLEYPPLAFLAPQGRDVRGYPIAGYWTVFEYKPPKV